MNTIILSKYPNHRMFNDAATVFAQRHSDDTLCFGVYQWEFDDIAEVRKQCRHKFIAFQSELLYAEGGPWKNALYIKKLQQFDEVWDYSTHNIPWLKEQGIGNIKYVPIEPSPHLKQDPIERDIDILHIGNHFNRRRQILNALIKEGYVIHDVLSHHNRYIFEDEIRKLYLRSRVVLGIHAYKNNPIQESFRYQYPLSNGITVLAEKSLSNPLGLEEFSNIEELVDLLQKYVQPKQHDSNWYMDNYIFTCVEEDIDLLGRMDALQCMEFVECMLADAKTLVQLRNTNRRQGAVRVVNARLFRDMLYVLRIVMLNKVGLDDTQRRLMYSSLKEVYASLYRPPLRKIILSTGGRFWPRLRCAIQLSGWSILCTTMRLFLLFHSGDKYITRSMVLPTREDGVGDKCK